MDEIQPRRNGTIDWQPFTLQFDRVVVDVDVPSNTITINAPITMSINRTWGGGNVCKYKNLRIHNAGVENVDLTSEFNPNVKCINKYLIFLKFVTSSSTQYSL